MIYIKKDEFKNIKHVLKDEKGSTHIIEQNTLQDTELNKDLYERHRFMFDVVEAENVEETKTIEPDVSVTEEIKVEESVDSETEQTVLEKLEDCKTGKEIKELALEVGLDLDDRLRNKNKLKEDFLEKYNE